MSKQSAKTSAGDLFARKGSAKPAGQLIAYERIVPNGRTPDPAPESDPVTASGEAAQTSVGEHGNDAADEDSTMAGSLLEIEFRKQGTEAEAHTLQGIPRPSSRDALSSPAGMQRRIRTSFQKPEADGRKPLRFSTPTDFVSGSAEPVRPTPVLPRTPRHGGSRLGTILALVAGCFLVIGAWFALEHRSGKTTIALDPVVPESESVAEAAADQADPTQSADAAEPVSTPDSTVEPNFDLIRVEPDGEAVIAGRAAPNAELILLDNGEPIGAVTANWAGEWAFIPEKPLVPGNHQFSLVVKDPQGTVSIPAPMEESGSLQAPSRDDSALQPDASESPKAAIGKTESTAPESPRSTDAEPMTEGKSSPPGAGSDQQSGIPGQGPPIPPHKPTLKETAALGGGSATHYMIQLSSTHSQTGAQKEWLKLTRIFPSLLDGMELNVHKATVDPLGTRYRVRTGQFADQDHAQALCQKFQSLDQECLVIKR